MPFETSKYTSKHNTLVVLDQNVLYQCNSSRSMAYVVMYRNPVSEQRRGVRRDLFSSELKVKWVISEAQR